MSAKVGAAHRSRYYQRNLNSVFAPLESDSDPDFTPGVFVYERKKKRGPRASEPSPSRHKGAYSRKDVIEKIGSSSKFTRRLNQGSIHHNPLLKYFDDDTLGLQSAPEDEDEQSDGGEYLDEEEDDDTNSQEHESNSDDSTTVKNRAVPNISGFVHKTTTPLGDDSATESESDVEVAQIAKRRYPSSPQESLCSKRRKISTFNSPTNDSSATESDSEPLPEHILSSTKNALSNSETEEESDADSGTVPHLQPRPNFSLAPDQAHGTSFILDHEKHIRVPAHINTYLRQYQREGVSFFWNLFSQGRGGVLGDDMGLVISFLSAIMNKHGDIRDLNRRKNYVSKLQDGDEWKQKRYLPPANARWPTCLIIAPSTVVYNWEREFQQWGYFEVGLYVGVSKERHEVLNDFKMGRLDVVVTSFDFARKEISQLDDLPWSCIIVDEAHRLKNPTSQITRAYHQFVCPIRFGLTGTAIQNSYMEMWTILDWTNPGKLGTTKQWKGFVVRPLTVGQSAAAGEEERTKALIVARILRDKLLPEFFKRRTKEIIKDQLPKKTDEVVFCPLTPIQIAVYKRILAMDAVQNLVRKDELCDCGSREKRKECHYSIQKGDALRCMSILIKISNHLALILPAPSDSPEQTARNRELSEVAFPSQDIPKYGPAMLQPQFCGKWVVLDTLLREWRKDNSNKVLIFTKSVKLIDMLEFHFNANSYSFLKLDGSTKQSERMPMIDKFNQDSDVFIFLISTLAGGTGLNLTGANKVVIFDPNWNPAHDLQAMDRAYRFGQTRDVSVYRLLGAGSIEELIYARQLYKQQQMAIGYQASIQTRYFQGVQGDINRQGELFGIKNIFRLHEDTLATKMAIERASIMELDWALAHLHGKSKKTKKSQKDEWADEEELRGAKEEGDLRGLTTLLFDDDPPRIPQQDGVHSMLDAIGVKYSHRNDDVLLPSRIEEERSHNVLQKKRQRTLTKKAKVEKKTSQKKSPDFEWPPKRKHHQTPLSPKSKLASRQTALLELGLIKTSSDLPEFAQSFARKTLEEQQDVLAQLDRHVMKSS